MKHFSKLAALALACSLWSCSDDAPGNEPGTQDAKGDFFAKITLQLPTANGSRSETVDPSEPNEPSQSNNGFEVGKDYENAVKNLTVVLASKEGDNYTYVTSGDGTPSSATTDNSQPTFTLQFQSEALQNHAGQKLYIFAFCNGAPSSIQNFANATKVIATDGNKFTDENGNQIIGIDIADENGFLMANAKIPDVTIPSWETLTTSHSTANTAYPLGTVPVERAASRFDFKQTKIGDYAFNTYPIYEDATTTPYATIELQEMALFNEAKEFYFLRHTSADGTATNMTLCGVEYGNTTTDNYVVNPNWELYQAYNTSCTGNATPQLPDNLAAKFFYPLKGIAGSTNWTSLTSLTADDNHNSNQTPTWPNNSDINNADYKIWRYATENTILGIDAQRQGITTGVVFKGEIKPVENTTDKGNKIKAAIEAKERIYAYRDHENKQSSKSNLAMVFGSAMDVYNYFKSNQSSSMCESFIAAVKAGDFEITLKDQTSPMAVSENTTAADIFGTSETTVEVESVSGFDSNSTASKNRNFICYAPDTNGKYFVYYYYYNRHNNNGNNAEMGPMEFATVRNNIYKLKVDNVTALGLPQDTPPDPWTPDENPEVYFKVSVLVLDWVVRINNIIF